MEHKCIYCGKEDDLSKSDIIPDALTNAGIYNQNVCRTEHNNKFSDMFESKVIDALSFITNKLNIKSSKSKEYAPYGIILTIDGVDYNTPIRNEQDVFEKKVLESIDKSHKIGDYDTIVKIAKDENKVCPIDIHHSQIKGKIKINNGIFFDQAMYRLVSKIAFEWYCAKNNVVGYNQEFDNIITFITTGKGENPVSIIQEITLYELLDKHTSLGSHTLFAFETVNGEIEVVVSLFGLLMYRVLVTKENPKCCYNKFLFIELCIDKRKIKIEHKSMTEADKKLLEITTKTLGGLLNGKSPQNTIIASYYFLFDMVKGFNKTVNDIMTPNNNIKNILNQRLKKIIEFSAIDKNSIKRFVNTIFPKSHTHIQSIQIHQINSKDIAMLYIVYLIGLNGEDKLTDSIFEKILEEKFPYTNIDDDEIKIQLRDTLLKRKDYLTIIENGAEKIRNWSW